MRSFANRTRCSSLVCVTCTSQMQEQASFFNEGGHRVFRQRRVLIKSNPALTEMRQPTSFWVWFQASSSNVALRGPRTAAWLPEQQ
ncbi:hypothetical protein FF2_045739 [Malus domestica]